MLSNVVISAFLLFLRCRAESDAFGPIHDEDYSRGRLGRYPEAEFATTNFVGPRPLIRRWHHDCHTKDKLLLTPYGRSVEYAGPLILDSQGKLVWHGPVQDDKTIYRSLSVQQYHGGQYLTYWKGRQPMKGIGEGSWYMLDQQYQLFKEIRAYGNISADFHDFAITDQSTALLTSYVKTKADLSEQGGSAQAWVWDSVFQEIDLADNSLLFEWHASDHFSYADCFYSLPMDSKPDSGSEAEPWDWFHINSIQKDSKGNFLLSARYLHGVAYIDGSSRNVKWILGGKKNSFHDLSNGRATNTAWQHDARWSDNETSITIFDNRATTTSRGLFPAARAIKVKLDQNAMTAKLVYEVVHPLQYVSVSQGSMQELPNGNMLVGYGSTAAVTEFAPDRSVICDMSFEALFTGPNYSLRAGSVMNYRALKQMWTGRPWYDPAVSVEGDVVYVSWNGATEVARWVLEAYHPWRGWVLVDQTIHDGFESQINVESGDVESKGLRLTAFNERDGQEGQWLLPITGSSDLEHTDL